MTLEPKQLSRGWQLKTLRMAVNLLYRGKRDALLVFVLLPCLIYFLPTLPLKILSYAFCFIAFYCFCLKYDTHQDVSWFRMFMELGSQFQLVIGIAVTIISMTYLLSIDGGVLFSEDNILSHLSLLPLLGIMMYLGYLLGMVFALPSLALIFLLLYAITIFWFKVIVRSDVKMRLFNDNMEKRMERYGLENNPIYPITVFGPYLFMHTDLTWGIAGEKAKQWIIKQRFVDIIQIQVVSVVCVLTLPIFIAGIPLLYSLYKQIFWNGDLEPRQAKQIDAIKLQQDVQA
tara:strand:+ start:3500 stop:4360 length:861 start_codon:yes stop_codon:yes gene_type:complete